MTESDSGETISLPVVSDKELLAMNQLMAEKEYGIKLPFSFLRPDKSDRINPEFVLYTLNDYLGHVQSCIASTRKMIPPAENKAFYQELAQAQPMVSSLVAAVCGIDIRQLSSQLAVLQKNANDVSVSQLVPFTQLLFQPLIRVYYLGYSGVSKLYKALYLYMSREQAVSNPDELKRSVELAIEEWHYLFSKVYPGFYPLILRMCSSSLLSITQLFYANGSHVLSWLGVQPAEVLILREGDLSGKASATEQKKEAVPVLPPSAPAERIPPEVRKGLTLLERLFPESGWDRLEEMPDMCAYFQPILQFQDGFTQLAPENPLHQMMILFFILEDLFQGLRHIKFEALEILSLQYDVESIDKILEDWILYQENVFDKTYCVDLKAYTHQIYTQPDYYKSPYGQKLLANMYTLTKHMFLPWFNINLYGTVKSKKEERLPAFYLRVSRLKNLLDRYYAEIAAAPEGSEQNIDGSVPGIINPWEPYTFDIANSVSRRLDAICGGKHSKTRTNALLIEHTLSILNVLDWWINSKDSFAYAKPPLYLYRVVEPGSSVPAFGVTSRSDVDALFIQHLKVSPVS
jgi:hypothetical protein